MEDSLTDLEFVQMFESAEQATDEARQNSELSRDYYDNKQWTAAEVQELKRRGQPVITDNVVAGKVNWLLGQEMTRRTDPKAFPRRPGAEQGAEAVTDSVRFVCDNNRWDEIRSGVWENMLIEGYGGCEVTMKTKRGQLEIVINQYPWDRLFYDPHSRKADFSDARYLGGVIWSDGPALERKYPNAKEAIGSAMNQSNSLGDTFEDRPSHQIWGDGERKRVRVVLMYYLDDNDVWHTVKFTKGAVLTNTPSPFVDEDGASVCPLLMQSAYVDRDNNRYSEAWKMLSQQDEINKRRSKLLHLANSRQTMSVEGAVKSVTHLKRELAKPDGHVEYTNIDDTNRPSFQMIPTNDMATSQFALLQEAKQSLSDMGATEALMGSADGDSGRAVLAKQQGAAQSLTPLNDKLHQFTRRVYEAIWQRIRQYWTEEKWIRVTDDERNVRFVGLNRPITLQETLSGHPEDVVMQFARENQLVPNDPRFQQVVGVENNVQELDVDLIMEEVPDTVTLESETFEQLVNIDAARGGVLPIEMLIKASPLRSKVKSEILDFFEQQKEAQAQGQQQGQDVQGQFMQLDMADRAANIEKTNAETRKVETDAMKNMAEARRVAMGY